MLLSHVYPSHSFADHHDICGAGIASIVNSSQHLYSCRDGQPMITNRRFRDVDDSGGFLCLDGICCV